MFDEQYKRLNKHQKEAVDAIEGPVMVIAGPGTGKTTILTLRIANILKRTDTPPHGILAITYTDAGVKAMREKLYRIIGARAHEVAIHTFHSFAAAMIAEYPEHFLHMEGLRVMTDIEQESLIRTILEGPLFGSLRPIGKPEAYVSPIIRAIDDSKREALTPDKVRGFAREEIERIKSDEDSISTRGASKGKLKAEAEERIEKCERTILFADVYERYEHDKREAKQMDFNDLITELLVALRNDQLLLRLIQERFLYLLVDEHQDTNDAQNFIVAMIAEFFETPNIFIVGDEKQAIYRFQGASVENFLLLERRWPAMKVISLDTNYRSHQSILDASFSMIENNYDGDEHKNLRVPLVAKGGEAKRPIDVVTGENVGAEEAYLVHELRDLMKGEPKATIAVIVRRNRELERVIRLLEFNRIPVSSERSVDIFTHPAGVPFFDMIQYLVDPTRTDALARTCMAGLWGLSFEGSIETSKLLKGGITAEIPTRIPALKRIREEMLSDGAVGFIITLAELSGLEDLITRDPSYVHVWRGIVTLAESLARDRDIRSPLALMQALLEYRLSAESKTVKVSVGAPDLPIQAKTAHGSKGLEFDYVFIPYATEEAWVGKSRGSFFVLPQKRAADHDIRDTRRLFYVALTRARKHVTILNSLQESDGKVLSPLRFIAELDKAHIKETLAKRPGHEGPSLMQSDGSEAMSTGSHGIQAARLTDTAKHVLLESGLSVTALNHFLECPSKFLYESVLRVPQAPSVSAEKGTAMHEALSRVWSEKDRSRNNIQRILAETVQEYFSRSFLAKNEKDAIEKELIEASPVVAASLESHFAAKGPVFTEHWLRTTLDFAYKSESIRLPIHGKLDAIVESGDSVSLFDYKTRQGMSDNEIKGETKNSNGNYFRQLEFYRLLMSDNPRWKNKHMTFSLVFVSPDKKGRCPISTLPISEDDIKKLNGQIQQLIDSVWSGALARSRCADRKCVWCGLKEVSLLSGRR
jgi:DNA helicase-2/ATP-dependent DNA helicase PcrA